MFVGNSMSQKLINELTEQILYGCRIDEFEEDKRNSSYKISLISPKATIYLNNENFKIITTDNQTRIKFLIEQLIVPYYEMYSNKLY
ncbi:unnamed protein product [Rhizophagus irregularis]|nr:unnamed protein product [Rhizophagus irregularis]CAB5390759.1 unnamed protein product [Rhizophagus irregularis]